MALPALSQRLLVNQSIAADAAQPSFATVKDGLSGVAVPDSLVGVALVNCEKLGLLSSSHYVSWGAGVLVGEVTIETADEVTYTGAWMPVAVVNFATGVTPSGIAAITAFDDPTQAGPRQSAVNIVGAFKTFRHRITGSVQGGTVTTSIAGAV